MVFLVEKYLGRRSGCRLPTREARGRGRTAKLNKYYIYCMENKLIPFTMRGISRLSVLRIAAAVARFISFFFALYPAAVMVYLLK